MDMRQPVPSGTTAKAEALLSDAETLYQIGRTKEAVRCVVASDDWHLDNPAKIRLLVLRGVAAFELGDVVGSLTYLAEAVECAKVGSLRAHFDGAFALFGRATDFQAPDELLAGLVELRQLASAIRDD